MKSTLQPTRHVTLLPEPLRLARTLTGIALLLVGFSLLGLFARFYTDYDHLHRYARHFVEKTNLDGEVNLPAFFAAVLLLSASALLGVIGRAKKDHPQRTRWNLLALIFLLLAADEVTRLHELLNATTLREYAPTTKYLHYTWVVPGIGFAAAVFVFYVPFLRALPRRTAGLMLLAGGLYVGGAVGVEMLGAGYLVEEGEHTVGYNLLVHVEETLEMSGLITFVYTLLDFLRAESSQLAVVTSAERVVESSPASR